MSQLSEMTHQQPEAALTEQIASTERFTGMGVNVVVIALAIVAIVPLFFSTRFWELPAWQIGLVLFCWIIYVVNGTGGMMLHERFLHFALAPYFYFGLQLTAVAGLLFLTRETGTGSIWILILPIAAQTLSRSRLFTAVTSLVLLALIWLAYFPNQPFWETIVDLLSIGAAMVFTLIFTSIAVRESVARTQIQKLATDLRQANHRLAEYAAQVEELATMRERNRVAREIHDNLGHYLTVVNVQIEAAKTVMAQNPEKAQDALSKAQNLTQDGLAAVRHSVSALRESPLENQSLAEAIGKLAEEAREAGLVVDWQIEGQTAERDRKVELTLYRAVQEGLTNVRKHARASRVDLALRYEPEQTVLRLQDNGIGADLSQRSASSFGLVGIEERVQLLNGRMQITTAPQQGFQFTITLPN
ncbi:MAG: sensor histidine kinase [Ardenticatenaceae bacterium]|nr:sensor histidine kinase [Anaerolineales bacterium]MCB8942104.1 sensor histidine kinase [Ardenticatenaceae bacterium]MCB8973129.1 sensor histidine kinase [Ardenticatenaceae bacterium]